MARAASEAEGAWRALFENLWPADAPAMRVRTWVCVALTLVGMGLLASGPLFLRGIIDYLTLHAAAALPLTPIIFYPLARAGGYLLVQLRVAMLAEVIERGKQRIAVRGLEHLHALSMRFHLDRQTGAMARLLERGASALDSVFRMIVVTFAQVGMEALIACIIIARVISPSFALIVAAALSAHIVTTLAVTHWQVRLRREMSAEDSRANALCVDSLLNYETVKYFGAEAHEAARFSDVRTRYRKLAVRAQAAVSSLIVSWYLVEAAAMMLVLIIAANDVAHARMSLGAFVMVQAYMMQLFVPLSAVGNLYREMRQSFVDLGLMQALLDEPIEVRDAPHARALSVSGGAIVFDNVSFGYTPEHAILRDVSFEIPAGRTLALVGVSGAGKSTIGRLLCRFYDLQAGAIRIDGCDIGAATQASIRAAIGVVPQDTMVFNETIFYNIAYGRRGATRADVIEAARLAQLDRFIEGLPRGYDTQIGERGLKLSGGERQRLAIARMILKRPPIFLFDEATSSLDSDNERAIQRAMREASAGRTRLIIAHRLSTVADADEIIVLDRGQVAERGDHGALLRTGARYAALWDQQLARG